MVKVIKKSFQDTARVTKIDRLLRETDVKNEESAASRLAKKHNLPYLDLNLFPVSGEDIHKIPEADSNKHAIGVIGKSGDAVKIAIVEPDNQEALQYIEALAAENGYKVEFIVVSLSSMKKIWAKYKTTPLIELMSEALEMTGRSLDEFEEQLKKLIELKKRSSAVSTTEVITIIMAGAIKMGASDIHFEPQETDARLRYRLDGMLQDIGLFPLEVFRTTLNRIKMLSKMKLNVRDVAQDGSFTSFIDKDRIDVRVSTMPGTHGEIIVMRLLNQSSILLGVEDLGLRGFAYEQLVHQYEKPSGMILTTGPTGSGKTTTLYAIINKLNQPDVKIVTIEDPVEYQIKGIGQTQIAKDRGYTFAKGLRAIVRQDPDVILVGEIRDEETVDIAVNAALTGHLVLSTLHTNSAAATIPRMLELGVKPNLIAPSVNCFIAQRLVRKICGECKEKYVPAEETSNSIKKVLAIISPKAKVEIPKSVEYLYRPKGCSKCHNTGYKGRMGIYEVLTITESIGKLIMEMAGEAEIARDAMENGMITMTQDGVLKAIEGLTSMDEVDRVGGQGDFLASVYEKLMEQSLAYAVKVSGEDLKQVEANMSSLQTLGKLIETANQKQALKYCLAGGLFLDAGDVHIEPEETSVLIRYRIDGILQTVAHIPLNEYPSFLGEIKVACGIKTQTREGVKDSRFTIELEELVGKLKEKKTDVRVSIILGGFGETVVMRLLNKSAVALDINSLGIRKQNLEKIIKAVEKPNGIFLNTGPTGSGKTTTLYSLLGVVNKPDIKIITVEDPIEYQVKGILQTQTNAEANYTFATALRALMRQNPDIIMIGEIRDNETADIALQAALTGHLVVSTIHTNDAPGAIPRLINMGVRADDLAVALSGFMAQRLVRKLCDCKEKIPTPADQKAKMEEVIKTISPLAGVEIPSTEFIYQPKGCEKCNQIGFKGRTTVSEFLNADNEIREMISANALSFQIKQKAVTNGMITMLQDGVLKVMEGTTTMEEVYRVCPE